MLLNFVFFSVSDLFRTLICRKSIYYIEWTTNDTSVSNMASKMSQIMENLNFYLHLILESTKLKIASSVTFGDTPRYFWHRMWWDCRGGSRTSPRRGRQPSAGGAYWIYLLNFLKNCMKLKTFWSRGGGGRVPGAPPSLRSATGWCLPRKHLTIYVSDFSRIPRCNGIVWLLFRFSWGSKGPVKKVHYPKLPLYP